MLHGVVQKAGIQHVTLSSVHVHPSVIACNCIATRCKETIINIFMSFLYSGKFQTAFDAAADVHSPGYHCWPRPITGQYNLGILLWEVALSYTVVLGFLIMAFPSANTHHFCSRFQDEKTCQLKNLWKFIHNQIPFSPANKEKNEASRQISDLVSGLMQKSAAFRIHP